MSDPNSELSSAPAQPPPGADLRALLARVRVVLVGTQHPGNIGSAARAMKTMGLSRLALVAPEKAPNHESMALAAGADDVLAAASTHATLAEALADCRLVLGCTARSRRVALDELSPRAASGRLLAAAGEGAQVALVFGRERTGLDNEELQLCHAAVHIPADPGYSSLNLAAAVQVLAYELRMAALDAAPAEAGAEPRDPPASHAQLEGFFAQLGQALDAIDFHKGRAPESALRKLRRLYLRADLDQREVRLLRGILADTERMAMLAGRRGGDGPGA
ncbi:RNA methyltransferase [Lysobacter silvisoli]|uniref:tRNA (cytidine/uridine-2'-O-)-methyltransferase TrmJ n=1 Tax=Lysobacter silvisoli TaxID=2293254 RepID=A0A371K574_9GAMM|nr:RNA methyltransferase [Lysobacter silvisoli]RDZ29081.1 RNA methyltransferase [Lysobacter silvisoli]